MLLHGMLAAIYCIPTLLCVRNVGQQAHGKVEHSKEDQSTSSKQTFRGLFELPLSPAFSVSFNDQPSAIKTEVSFSMVQPQARP